MSEILPYRLTFAEVCDREKLQELHRNVRYEIDFPLVPEYTLANLNSDYYDKIWRQTFPTSDGSIPVIKADNGAGEIIGFCRYGTLLPLEYPPEKLGAYKDGLAELHQLYIKKEYRGKFGLGRKLYEAAKENLSRKSYKHMLIALIEGNVRARAFYEKMGAVHYYTYLDKLNRNGVEYRKNVCVYLHKNI